VNAPSSGWQDDAACSYCNSRSDKAHRGCIDGEVKVVVQLKVKIKFAFEGRPVDDFYIDQLERKLGLHLLNDYNLKRLRL